jgi:hypothetical protein
MRIGVGLVTVVLLLSMPASAAASNGISGGLKYVSGSRQESFDGGADEHAYCGRGWISTGGGGTITGTALGTGQWMIGAGTGAAGMPRRPDQIYASFNVVASRVPATITAYAICKQRNSSGSTFTLTRTGFDYSSGGLKYIHREGDIAGGESKTIKASCGSQTLTGGTAIAFMDNGFLNVSEPLDEPTDDDSVRNDAWRALFHDFNVGRTTFMQAEAICAPSRFAFAQALHYVQSQPNTVPAGQVMSSTAACGAGRVVTGGGVYASGPVSEAAVTGTAPTDFRDADTIPDDGWTGTVANVSGGSKTVTAYAICKQT